MSSFYDNCHLSMTIQNHTMTYTTFLCIFITNIGRTTSKAYT